MYFRLHLSKSSCNSGCVTHTLLPCCIMRVCIQSMLLMVKVNPRACDGYTAVYGVSRCVCVLKCVDNVWCLVPCCVHMCVCQNCTSCLDRLSFHEAIGTNEPVEPRFSRGHAPLPYARTNVALPTCSSHWDCCVFFLILYRKVVYFKLLFWHKGVGKATDRGLKQLVGFREGSLTMKILLRHARAMQLLCLSWHRHCIKCWKNKLETSSGKRTFLP